MRYLMGKVVHYYIIYKEYLVMKLMFWNELWAEIYGSREISLRMKLCGMREVGGRTMARSKGRGTLFPFHSLDAYTTGGTISALFPKEREQGMS